MIKLSKTLSVVLGLTIMGAVVALIYVITVPVPGDVFTEFYILGPGGKAADYPARLRVGEEGEVTLGIVNQERETTYYRVEVRIEGVTNSELGPIVLKHGEKFERITTFTPNKPGFRQKVEFLLYKQGQSDIYDSLHLLVNVEE